MSPSPCSHAQREAAPGERCGSGAAHPASGGGVRPLRVAGASDSAAQPSAKSPSASSSAREVLRARRRSAARARAPRDRPLRLVASCRAASSASPRLFAASNQPGSTSSVRRKQAIASSGGRVSRSSSAEVVVEVGHARVGRDRGAHACASASARSPAVHADHAEVMRRDGVGRIVARGPRDRAAPASSMRPCWWAASARSHARVGGRRLAASSRPWHSL